MNLKKKNFLLVRNDKIGDFMLTWPAISYLKKNMEDAHITCLVSKDVERLAVRCKNIDEIITDQSLRNLKKIIKEKKFDAAISFFSTFRIGYLLKSCKIPLRIAPATKLAQFFYNHKLKQKRSNSKKPEHEYNTDLVVELLEKYHVTDYEPMDEPPYLVLDKKEAEEYKKNFCNIYKINLNKKILFIHPGTGGSSKNLSIDDYVSICKGLRSFDDHNFIIHYSPYEKKIATELYNKLKNVTNVKLIRPTNSVDALLKNINLCDVFISGSTGPLHIAGALNKQTVGFYPSKKSSTHLRWETINNSKNRLHFTDLGGSFRNIKIDEKKTILEIQKFIGVL
ncbi:MAG: hypothetical protein CMD65_01715 [Gammaproteobacteria bacterium]|nr:hypothetical protein [Gammaproteobacteria bacterium]|tara:strand:- start:1120 stop:2133 length:1014 start_codon:yes stop_codon:yes gene_type:complete